MFNELPSSRRKASLQKKFEGIADLNRAVNYINFDEAVQEEFNANAGNSFLSKIAQFASLGYVDTQEVKAEGQAVEIPTGTKIIGDEKFIRFGALMQIINSVGAKGYLIGKKQVTFRINSSKCVCSAFDRMFSTDKTKLFIPNPHTPKFSLAEAINKTAPQTDFSKLQDNTVNKQDPSYLPYQINSGTNTYSDGDIFTAGFTIFTVIQGQGSVILLDPIYHLADIEDSDTHFRNKILPKSTAIATYDLSENSKIGKYLRNIQNNPGYTSSLIDVRFEENQLTTYNGVNYRVGIFDKKGDYYFDYFSSAETQIGFEDFITDGFRKNGIISYKLYCY
jgi:hypothetical protein